MIKKKNLICFLVVAVLLIALIVETVIIFNKANDTSSFKLESNYSEILSVDFDEDEYFVTTNDGKIVNYDEDGIKWKLQLTDKVAEISNMYDKVAVSYVSERRVDVIAKGSAKTDTEDAKPAKVISSFDIPYEVVGIATDNSGMFVAAKKSGLKGSIVYYYNNLSTTNVTSCSFPSEILQICVDPVTEVLYGITADYNLYTFTKENEKLTAECFGSIKYEPLSMAMAGESLYVADMEGNVYIFTDKVPEYGWATGQSACAFDVNYYTGYAAVANINGSVTIVELATGEMRKISAPTEISSISVSDEGVIAMSEHRSFNTSFFTISNVDNVSTMKVLRWVCIALVVLIAVFLVCLGFTLTEKNAVKLVAFGKKVALNLRKSGKSYALILPTFVLLIVFSYLPAVKGLIQSFYDFVPGVYSRFVGFDNIVAVFKDPWFTGGIKNMLIFLVADLAKALIPAVCIAEVIFATNSKKMQYWERVLLYIPGLLPGVASMLIWTKGVYGDMGLLNSLVTLFGGEKINWIGNPQTSLLSLILTGFPWVGQYILFYGALMGIPPSYREAAKLDGCSWLRTVFTIDLPLIRPQLKYVFITTFIASLQDFGRVYVMIGATPTEETVVPALQMYLTLVKGDAYGKASAMGLILFIVIFSISLVLNRKSKKDVDVV